MRSKLAARWALIIGSHLLAAALAVAAAIQVMKAWAPGYSTPARAEFSRRLHAAGAVGGAEQYRFFYATTRPRGVDLLNDAATERSASLSLGSYDARISAGTTVEALIWDDQEFLALSSAHELAADSFFAQLRSVSERSPHRSVMILVWGWKERWATAAARSAYLSYVLDIGTPVVLFDWPANQGDDARGYVAAQQVARASGAELGRLIEAVIERVHPQSLWVVALSMGSQVVCDAFDYMAQQPHLSDAEREIAHVVLAAPDVAQDEFDRKFGAQIARLSQHLTVYVSSTDQALLLSHWLNRRARLGRVAKTKPEGLQDAQFLLGERLLDLKAQGSPEIEIVDVTPINRHRNRHHFLTDDAQFLDELYLRLLRPTEPLGRRLYPVRATDRAAFWILWDE